MTAFYKKALILLVMTVIVFAGIFCYESVVTTHDGCMDSVSSVWCDEFVFHGTLVSYALIGMLFAIPLLLVVYLVTVFDFGKQLQLFYIRQHHYYRTTRIFLFKPLQTAFSKGIIHPYIP